MEVREERGKYEFGKRTQRDWVNNRNQRILNMKMSQTMLGGSDEKGSTHNAGYPGSIPLEKGMGTHSCILAWRIPWTEEPGGL